MLILNLKGFSFYGELFQIWIQLIKLLAIYHHSVNKYQNREETNLQITKFKVWENRLFLEVSYLNLPRLRVHKSPSLQPLIPPYMIRYGVPPLSSLLTYTLAVCDSLGEGGVPVALGYSQDKAFTRFVGLSSNTYKSFRYLQQVSGCYFNGMKTIQFRFTPMPQVWRNDTKIILCLCPY